MADSSKAVFLSYASQDAEAARRIAESLRAAGVEVWFDQEGGLEHGDEWDRKIRKQIKECVLFLPLISAHTQEREEGYFRIEWDLAAERAQGIASGVAFILPIVIDRTREADALVPDRFRKVQWTRLPGGEVAPDVLARFLKLWSHRTGVISHQVSRAAAASEGATPLETTRGPGWRRWSVVAVVTVGLVAGATWWLRHHLIVTEAAKTMAPVSEARQLVSNAWEQLNKAELARAELEVADELCKRAAALDPNDADVWAAWSQVDSWYIYHNLDNAPQRREGARTKAARALQLAPDSYEARLAQACHLVRGGGDHQVSMFAAEADGLLRVLLQEKPGEPRALLTLAILSRNTGKADEARELFNRMAKNPAFAALALNELGWAELINSDYRAAETAVDASIALQPYWGNLGLKCLIARRWWGDLALAKATMDRIPAAARQDDIEVSEAVEIYYWRREPENMLRVLNSVPRDWLRSNTFDGPKAWWTALAQQMAGHDEAAQMQWRTALKLVERRLADQPDSGFLLRWKGLLLAASGNRSEGETALRLAREMGDGMIPIQEAIDQVRLGNLDAAITLLERAVELRLSYATAATYRLNPLWDLLRGQPRFKALLARMEADPRTSPNAPDLSAKALGTVDQKSVAVLAFANLSDDKGNEYFSDGISEELLNVLAKIPGLKVAARTSAFYFKGKQVPMVEIAQQLGVAYVVEGSVRKAGDKVRITAQLIKAADGFHVWSDTFTRDLKDIFAVQDEIAGLIAKNLELKMGMTAARPTIDLEAYQEYLAGRAAVAKAGNADLQEAVSHFERAVLIEPKFTASWVQLAGTHTQLGRWGGAPTLQSWAAARAAIDHAVALEPDSPDVLLALGWVRRTADWDWRGAEQAFRRALELRPNHPETLAGAAVLLYNIGKDEEAFRLGQLAAQLDPLNPATQIDLSIMFYLSNKLPEAERTARRALQLAPAGAGYHSILGWGLMGQRRYDEAVAEAVLDTDEVQQASVLGLIAVARGQTAAAHAQIARLEEKARTNGDSADLQNIIAWISAGLGEKDRAFAALEKARASRDPSISWLRNGPYLVPLFSDPRWAVLLHEVGLADDQLK